MTLQILVVEHHGDTRRALTHLLGGFGHSISAADTVKSALAFVRAKRFDIIVTDIRLPDGDGLEVIGEAKRRQPLVGVALSARNELRQSEQELEVEFDYYLAKPVDAAELRGVLELIAGTGQRAAA